MQESYLTPTLLFAPVKLDLEEWMNQEKRNSAGDFAGITNDLPESLNILTLEAVDETQVNRNVSHQPRQEVSQ